MFKRYFLPAIFLFLLGTVIGGVNSGNPVSEHWSLSIYAPQFQQMGEQFKDFSPAEFQDEESFFMVPVGVVNDIVFTIYSKLGFGSPLIAWMKGAITGLYLAGAFLALAALGLGVRPSFFASLLCAFSPPIVSSTWKVPQEPRTFAAALFFISIVFFCRIPDIKKNALKWLLAILFLLFAGTGIAAKETVKGYTTAFFLLYLFLDYRRSNNIDRVQAAITFVFLLWTAFLVVSFKQPMMSMTIPPEIMPSSRVAIFVFFALQKVGLLINTLTQFSVCFHAAGSLLIYAAFNKKGTMPPLGYVSIALLWLFPVLKFFSFHSMIVYPIFAQLAVAFSTLLLIFALINIARRHLFPLNLFAILAVYGITIVFLVTSTPAFMRDDASPRLFMTILPFIAILMVEAFMRLPGRTLKYYLAISIVFFCGSYFFNTAQYFKHFKRAELDAKQFLTDKDFNDTEVLFTNELFPLYRSDLRALGMPQSNGEDSRFFLLEPFKPDDQQDLFRDEICMKALNLTWRMQKNYIDEFKTEIDIVLPGESSIEKKDKILFYEIFEKSTAKSISKSGRLMNFSGYSSFAPRILASSDFMASRGYWVYSTPLVLSYYFTGRETAFGSLGEKLLKDEYSSSIQYTNLPPWLESIPSLLLKRLPLVHPVEARVHMRSTETDALNCSDDIPLFLDNIENFLEERKKM